MSFGKFLSRGWLIMYEHMLSLG